jgi:predicted alpha/beta hydrolase
VSTRGSARITAKGATEETLVTTGSRWERWAQPRPFPGVRPLRTTLRTAHLIAFGTLYGGHVYGLPAARLWPALLATVGTGAALMGLEVYRLPLWLFQLRGVATLVKIVLVAAVALCWTCSVWLLTAAIIIGSVAAHMPGRYRYYSVVHGRVIGEQESG